MYDTSSHCTSDNVSKFAAYPIGLCMANDDGQTSSKFVGCDAKTISIQMFSDPACTMWKSQLQTLGDVCAVNSHDGSSEPVYTDNYQSMYCSV